MRSVGSATTTATVDKRDVQTNGQDDATDDRWLRRWQRHEDDINWKMSTQQQVTPDRTTGTVVDGSDQAPPSTVPSSVAVDGENNPIKSLRRQRRVEGTNGQADTDTTPTTVVPSITAPTVPIAGTDTEQWSARLCRTAAIGHDEEDVEQPAVLATDRSVQYEGRAAVGDPAGLSGVELSKNSTGQDTANNNRLDCEQRAVTDVVNELEDALERKRHNTVNARRRWKLLAKALRHDSSEDDQFAKFNLIEADRAGDEKDENVYVYRLYDRYRLKLRLIGPERPWTASELIGFNNTGNICVWPSEEALAYYILSRLSQFDGTSVLELGGGMTCLAGLVLAKYGQPAFVHVTDGNELSVENVRKSLVLNKFNCTIKSSVLKWEQTTSDPDRDSGARYHFILSADCLFFDESRSQLIDTIWQSLAEEGVALITAPRRGQTLTLFLNECVARGFHYELLQCYNEAIWARHLELKQTDGYDENVHYPLLVKMYKYGPGSVLHRL
ncbi:calmodulin-lysine N-methyltransferase [Anopheles stephensi]|uniref:calmodulin-lysine N-methyltransferase n=1 Tax=Anopheles stephensi TaxID=30069 RepID=UPI001658BC5F|nr:calmodulin-lysine N-methyltransferase [Anopheles stephensi]XP_035914741.1 calmodulin-lysine N-methyltransferase [Anopheles stephensi]